MSASRSQGRASIACSGCRKQKVRCSGEQPCIRCQRMNLQCSLGTTSTSPGTPIRLTQARESYNHSSISKDRESYARVADGSRVPTPDDLPSRSPVQPLQIRDHRSQSPIRRAQEPVGPPFSTFTYQPAPDPPLQDFLVPPCAQPFPELQDPVVCGIISLPFATWLFNFYRDCCGPHIPLLLTNFEQTRRKSPFLLSSILSVAHVNTPNDISLLPILPDEVHLLGDSRISDLLANLALNHLAASLLRRIVSSEDAMATLNMALWNQRRDAAVGPSSWPLIGHGQRISRRIGIHESRPYTAEWFLVISLDIYDHLLTMEYGRPLTADRPPRPPNGPIPSDLTPSQISLLAQSELIQPMRRLIRWMTRTGPTPEQSIHDLLNRINDELDEWFFKWTSPASECSATLASSGTFSSVLAHHVRLCLNMLPIQMWDSGLNEATLSVLNKSQRLAIVSAMAIIDHFHHDFTTPISTTNLRFAPGIAGSILAHAVLCLLPKPIAVNRSARLTATLASGTTNSIVERYFEKGLGFLRGNRSNQGHFTPTFARTIEGLLGLDVITQESRGQEVSEAQQALLHHDDDIFWGPSQDTTWATAFDRDTQMGLMGWFEQDSYYHAEHVFLVDGV